MKIVTSAIASVPRESACMPDRNREKDGEADLAEVVHAGRRGVPGEAFEVPGGRVTVVVGAVAAGVKIQ
ncbi:MAG: hypothetical protein ACXV7G_12490 [Halobacteriota archaeon]